MTTLNLTEAEHQALLEAVVLAEAHLDDIEDEAKAERQRKTLNSAWAKVTTVHRSGRPTKIRKKTHTVEED